MYDDLYADEAQMAKVIVVYRRVQSCCFTLILLGAPLFHLKFLLQSIHLYDFPAFLVKTPN